MRVEMDFEEMYRAYRDPWSIGDADYGRYEVYRRMIEDAEGPRGTMLDVGCAMGQFMARFRDQFERLVGVEVTEQGVAKGRERFPFIAFVQGSAGRLEECLPDERYDAIVYSDVIYYLKEEERRGSLEWIADHLADGGFAFIAAWAPGGRYLEPRELERLVEHYFAVEEQRVLETGHVAFLCRRKRRLAALTLDYETWQPIPPGREIAWEQDVFEPTSALLGVCDAEGARLTLFAEMGEYFWLRDNEPALAERMEEQWREAARRGHDVQLHLHPNWLPELGAAQRDGEWHWDADLVRAHDYPGDLAELIARCVSALESAIRPVDPAYEVTSFRAGAYEAQPFTRLYDALGANGVFCDSSVVSGDKRADRHFDYRLAYSDHQPYLASRYDPQLKAPPAEREIVELPVFTPLRGQRWTFDGPEGEQFAGRLLEHRRAQERAPSSEALRRRQRLRDRLGYWYWRLRKRRRALNRLMPRRLGHFLTSYEPERLAGHDYYVLVGHSKNDLDVDAIRTGIRELREDGVELMSLSDLAREARAELERTVTADRSEEAERQVEIEEEEAVLGEERNAAQSERLQEMIPLDRSRILDLGCGAGDWSARIAERHPRAEVVGIGVGREFIEEARRRRGSDRVSFRVEDFAASSFADGEFDCVYADNTLEHAFDVEATLREAHRLLADGGVLVAAIPSDARNPQRVCLNHTWKTAPHDVRARLEAAGFSGVEIEEVDTFRELGMPPYPPADDRMMYVKAWRRREAPRPLERVAELTGWAYRSLDPERTQESGEPLEILRAGHAWCWGYVVVLGEALQREGYGVHWVTMRAEDHPRARGPDGRETHEVIEVELPDGSRRAVDAMAGVVFDDPVSVLVDDPARADERREPDARWRERGYELYATSEWYRRVRDVAFSETPYRRPRFR